MTEPLNVADTELFPVQVLKNAREVFRITPDGEIEKDGQRITDDDAAVADALREFVEISYGLKIRPANRCSHNKGE